MLLSINDRLTIINILQTQEGRIALLKTLRQARESLEIDEVDHVASNMRQDWTCPRCRFLDYFPIGHSPQCPLCTSIMDPGQQLRWDPRAPHRDLHIGETAHAVVAGHLSRMEADGKLTDALIDLYDKFCGG